MAGKCILVADDESHILNVVSLKLRNAGFEVLTAQDGNSAFAMASERTPDLLITDYHMPGCNGIELCQKLRTNAATANVPAIMLSARGYHLTDDDLAATGIRQMISKPFSPRELVSVVNEVLGMAA